ncbi:MAG: glycogen/starch/alpha-glucan phosphorylase [Roseofilum sp. Belize BBD 4]|nr:MULTISPECIES: glycogen/starch/alpha-glucan phosphorylase [unclassified Roseofilum]MBP0008633.1 glycogen/starch/alpha-glucan phosphorylase [Roseofilum sp. Belize Diploria]MBP0032232.1 glycogen/starch/alpha-glucan phosphorylase [Roseofilum sp. Belize BBD 4]
MSSQFFSQDNDVMNVDPGSQESQVEALKQDFIRNLHCIQGKTINLSTPHDYYMALAYTVRDRLLDHRLNTSSRYRKHQAKTVYYLSAEFLMGRQLSNNLLNLGIYDDTVKALTQLGLNLQDLVVLEAEPGLGNGGLGRLAACFLDSLATLSLPAIGYGIRYEFGIFDQLIINGVQIERPDKWLRYGNPWEVYRPEASVRVKFGGYTEFHPDESGQMHVRWIGDREITGTPYDTPVPGYQNQTVNRLRLWRAYATEELDFAQFDRGDYIGAVSDKIFSENISKVLYPNDNTYQGKQLRLEQQYFFVSCSLQDIINRYRRQYENFDHFHEKVAIQLNDTHPSIGVAELMRLLVDEYNLGWNRAWYITKHVFAYTNHTLLSEALETWPVSLFESLLPRHLEIIYEINQRFLNEVRSRYPGDLERLSRMSLVQEDPEKKIRMAHLACVGSYCINGVAQLHTDLLKAQVLPDFHDYWPQKVQNKTNGITPRRWLLLSNPQLSKLISSKIVQDWITDLDQLRGIEPYADDPEFQQEWQQIKYDHKVALAEHILLFNDLEVNPDSLFDIQVKRMHEYKRQLLNVLHIITLYYRIKQNPGLNLVPRTFIFAGKAAPGYFMAKMVIQLINAVARVVNHDPEVGDRLKVVFLAGYSVSLGQKIYPAADLSEQISMAGKEASGTGNMKFVLNGAVTIGTLDGANIEIREEVGEENFFLFGLTASQAQALKAKGYDLKSYYHWNRELKMVMDGITKREFSPENPELFQPIIDSLLDRDEYLLFADYADYINCQERVSQAYQDRASWTRKSILNTARIGKFSSDRAIAEYARDIWHIHPVYSS